MPPKHLSSYYSVYEKYGTQRVVLRRNNIVLSLALCYIGLSPTSSFTCHILYNTSGNALTYTYYIMPVYVRT